MKGLHEHFCARPACPLQVQARCCAYMNVDGTLLVPERYKQGIGVHGYVQDACNLPFALNANGLQILPALLVCRIYLAAPAHIQSCRT